MLVSKPLLFNLNPVMRIIFTITKPYSLTKYGLVSHYETLWLRMYVTAPGKGGGHVVICLEERVRRGLVDNTIGVKS